MIRNMIEAFVRLITRQAAAVIVAVLATSGFFTATRATASKLASPNPDLAPQPVELRDSQDLSPAPTIPTSSTPTPTNSPAPEASAPPASNPAPISNSCIVTIFGKQYDVQPLKTDHPGPKGDFFVCNTDMSNAYQSQHGANVSRLAKYALSPTSNSSYQTDSTFTSFQSDLQEDDFEKIYAYDSDLDDDDDKDHSSSRENQELASQHEKEEQEAEEVDKERQDKSEDDHQEQEPEHDDHDTKSNQDH